MKTKNTLYRNHQDKVRYYKLEIVQTLFNDFLLIREYGSVKNKKPTGLIKEYFNLVDEAKKKYKMILLQKIKKGYSSTPCQWV